MFDVYLSPSIKDIERKDRRDETCEVFSIGTEQKIQVNINDLLSKSNFKNELLQFLDTKYQDPFYAALIADKDFFYSVNNHYMKFYYVNQELKWIKGQSLFGEYLEADTQEMFHVIYANVEGAKNIVVCGSNKMF